MKKKHLAALIFFGGFAISPLVSPHQVLAAMSLSFSGLPSSINQDEEITVLVSLTGAPINTVYYFRAAFYVDTTTQYFGYTWNNSAWNNIPSDYKSFLQINTGSLGEFNGPLKAKTDLSSGYFKGTGEYQFKIGRYTEGGSGPTWSDSSATTITGPTPTLPDPTPTSSPTNTPTPTKTPTPSPTVTPTPTPASIPTVQPSVATNPLVLAATDAGEDSTGDPEIHFDVVDASSTGDVAGTEDAVPASRSAASAATEKSRKSAILTVLVVLGLGLVMAGGIPLLFTELRSRKTH